MYAYELLARLRAGMTMCGYDDGELQWIGTFQQWQKVGHLERAILGEIDEDYAVDAKYGMI